MSPVTQRGRRLGHRLLPTEPPRRTVSAWMKANCSKTPYQFCFTPKKPHDLQIRLTQMSIDHVYPQIVSGLLACDLTCDSQNLFRAMS